MSAEFAPMPPEGEPFSFVVHIGGTKLELSKDNTYLRTFDDHECDYIVAMQPDGTVCDFRPEESLVDALLEAGHVAVHSVFPDSVVLGKIGRIEHGYSKEWLM
jgi:hypothetical protein